MDCINTFIQFGEKLAGFGSDAESRRIIERAVELNNWFTPDEIILSVQAICDNMLQRDKLLEWLATYGIDGSTTERMSTRDRVERKNVGIIMAGNIPLVGFFDLLCVVSSGHKAYVKTSTKDSVLMRYIIDKLRDISADIPIEYYTDQSLDAIIATGSDNTNRYFRTQYREMPAILRGSRSSVAVLNGEESEQQLAGLADDIFTYSGLGCRNVSMLLIPEGYDIEHLAHSLGRHHISNNKYLNNYLQNKAVLTINKELFTDGGFFILRQSNSFPSAISEIGYIYYRNIEQATNWLSIHADQLQCVVGDVKISDGNFVPLGRAQYPCLTDYPDGVDVVAFLHNL